MYITEKILRRAGACSGQVDLFVQTFGDGANS